MYKKTTHVGLVSPKGFSLQSPEFFREQAWRFPYGNCPAIRCIFFRFANGKRMPLLSGLAKALGCSQASSLFP